MAKSFELVTQNGNLVKASNSLLEVWSYIRLYINEPRTYEVDQISEKGDIECSCTAYFLIENYKTPESLPLIIPIKK